MFRLEVILLCVLGCYSASVLCDENEAAKLRFYYNSINNYTELPLDSAADILTTSWYNSDKSTVIFTHGFKGMPTGPAVTSVLKAYIAQQDVNVAFLNWQFLASDIQGHLQISYLTWAVPNGRKLGVQFAETLLKMAANGFDLNKTHLLGHSLGAHILGIAGNTLAAKGVLVSRITGFDPAYFGFENKKPSARLNPGSAAFVAVIHTDPSRYGFRKSLGTVDFWPNYRTVGTVQQPGCEFRSMDNAIFSPKDLCNHNRSWELAVDALKYPGSLVGSYAKNYKIWKNYTKEERNAVVLDLLRYPSKVIPGNYYFATNASSPFGLGREGL